MATRYLIFNGPSLPESWENTSAVSGAKLVMVDLGPGGGLAFRSSLPSGATYVVDTGATTGLGRSAS